MSTPSLNRAYLVGRLGRMPETRTAAGGEPVLSLSIATIRAMRQEDGTYVDVTDWHRVTVLGARAVLGCANIKRGDTIAVECELRPAKWTDKDGVTHYEMGLVLVRVMWVTRTRRLNVNSFPVEG